MFETVGKRTGTSGKGKRAKGDTGISRDQATAEVSNLSLTGQVARWSAHHRWWVVATTVLVLVMAIFVSSAVETKLLNDNEFAEGESGKAVRLLEERFDDGGAPTEQLVQELRAMPEVSAVVSYYETGDPRLVSADQHVQRAQVEIADIAGSDDRRVPAVPAGAVVRQGQHSGKRSCPAK